MDRHTTIVVPCYNEAARFPAESFLRFADNAQWVRFVFVNDGSTDQTARVLERMAADAPDRFERIDQDRNRGKAEAVRTGILHAIRRGGRYVGYWDADLATPLEEIPRFVEALETHCDREVCFGARVQLLGRTIRRRPYRHYVGRVFATAAAMGLGLQVYDTQCGAKLFRVSDDLAVLFAEPFLGRWTFDIELIARLARLRAGMRGRGPEDVIYELPLDTWHDIDGSHVNLADFVKALIEIARIRRRYLSESRVSYPFSGHPVNDAKTVP
jgi:dolichyl-phosphate beta-glucosyltransferase